MARTYRNLWSQVVSWENLVAAYHKCRRRKRYRLPATEFDFAWEENLLQLQRDLLAGTYEHGPYYHFHISDPKPRKISAAPFRDRVLHHALVAVLEPIFEERFVFDSYACRIGKGTHRAIKRAQHFQRRFPWCLKTDIVKFFPSIDHEIMLSTLQKRIVDSQVMKLIETIVRSGVGVHKFDTPQQWFAGDDLFAVLRPRGVPIGNLTSQFFANVFLDPIDHFIKETMQVPGYIRYADDLLLFGDSKSQLWSAADRLVKRLGQCRLRLHPEKTHIYPTNGFIKYLGFRVAANEIRLSQQGIRRFIRRTRRQRHQFEIGQFDLQTVSESLMAWKSHLRGTNSRSIQRTLIHQHLRFPRRLRD